MRPLWLAAALCAVPARAGELDCADLVPFVGLPQVRRAAAERGVPAESAAKEYCEIRAAVIPWGLQVHNLARFPLEKLEALPVGLAALDRADAFDRQVLDELIPGAKKAREDTQAAARLNQERQAHERSLRRYAELALSGQAGLAHAYDKAAAGAGIVVAQAPPGMDVPRPPASIPAPRQPRLDDKDVPLETFDALTKGIELPAEPEQKALLEQAFRHMYDSPTGRRVLRDLQRMREEDRRSALAQLAAAKAKSPSERDKADETFLKYVTENSRLKIVVQFGGLHDALEGGHATVNHTELWDDGNFRTYVRLALPRPDDKNPARSVDKVLVHELRHQADRMLSSATGPRWHLLEDRAYAQESLSALEQDAEMRKKNEPKSDVVSNILKYEVQKIRRDAAGFSVDRLASPLYLWDVESADLDDPEAALRARLQIAFPLLEDYKPDPRIPAERRPKRDMAYVRTARKRIDPDGELAAVLAKLPAADAETPLDPKRQEAFVAAASKTKLARSWVAGLLKAKADFQAHPETLARMKAAEAEFYADLAAARR